MELRFTDTNAADDSAGRAFGLEGDLYLPVVIAVVAAVGLFALSNLALHVSLGLAGGIARGDFSRGRCRHVP